MNVFNGTFRASFEIVIPKLISYLP